MARVVIYSTRTGRIRRIITDPDRDLVTMQTDFPAVAGEDFADVTQDIPAEQSLDELQAEVSALTGLVPRDDRYAIVTSRGQVVGAIMADAAIDFPRSSQTLVAHPLAAPDWRQMRDGSWQRPLAEIDAEIATLTRQRDLLDSVAFRDQEALDPEGFTETEIDTRVAALDDKVVALAPERTARLAVR